MIRRRRRGESRNENKEMWAELRSVQIVHTFHVVEGSRQNFASSPCLQFLECYSVITMFMFRFSAIFRLPLARTSAIHWTRVWVGRRAIL